jgi:hypothetical protein
MTAQPDGMLHALLQEFNEAILVTRTAYGALWARPMAVAE